MAIKVKTLTTDILKRKSDIVEITQNEMNNKAQNTVKFVVSQTLLKELP